MPATPVLPADASGLPPLIPCPAGGQGGRHGLCAGVDTSPIALRGSNYIRLDNYHSTFDVGTYNRSRYLAAFKSMASDGYNVNRIFMDELPNRGVGGMTNSTAPLDSAWVDRLAEYITDAAAHQIYTIVTMVYVPDNVYFNTIRDKTPSGPAWASSWNKEFISASGQNTFTAYASVLAAELNTRLAGPGVQNAVLISLQNEFFLMGSEYPFNAPYNQAVTLADGVVYNMSRGNDRQQAADANTNLWATRARAAIREHLPTSLVFVGMFTFKAVNKQGPNGLFQQGCEDGSNTALGKDWANRVAPPNPNVDCRFPARPATLSQTDIDLLDVHIYEGDGSPAGLEANLVTEQWSSVMKTKPVIMGEFGCNYMWYHTPEECAPNVRDLQISSCAQGFSGWLFWTYDSTEQKKEPTDGNNWWHIMYNGTNATAINGILRPASNPDPCKR